MINSEAENRPSGRHKWTISEKSAPKRCQNEVNSVARQLLLCLKPFLCQLNPGLMLGNRVWRVAILKVILWAVRDCCFQKNCSTGILLKLEFLLLVASWAVVLVRNPIPLKWKKSNSDFQRKHGLIRSRWNCCFYMNQFQICVKVAIAFFFCVNTILWFYHSLLFH